MKKQMKGISLILFGILLNLVGLLLATCFPGELALIPGLFGIAFGLVGVFAVFSKEK